MTSEAGAVLRRADLVLSLFTDRAARGWLEGFNPRTRSLHGLFAPGRRRTEVYTAIADETLRHVRSGLDVCLAVYGHPGLFVSFSRDAIVRARSEGFPTRLLPGISAEDCLFADLGVDPALTGWQSYEATMFLSRARRVDPDAALVLWQVGVVGDGLTVSEAVPTALPALVEALLETYAPEHTVVVYEAAPYPGFEPLIRRVPLGELSAEQLTGLSTLYVPPRPGSETPPR